MTKRKRPIGGFRIGGSQKKGFSEKGSDGGKDWPPRGTIKGRAAAKKSPAGNGDMPGLGGVREEKGKRNGPSRTGQEVAGTGVSPRGKMWRNEKTLRGGRSPEPDRLENRSNKGIEGVRV